MPCNGGGRRDRFSARIQLNVEEITVQRGFFTKVVTLGTLFCCEIITGLGQRPLANQSPFGEKPPASPVLFSPGVISIPVTTTYRPAFSPDGRTVYYTMEVGSDYAIIVCRFKNGHWVSPEIAPFSGKYSDAEPFMSPDGSKLFFASRRPVNGEQAKKDYDLWVVELLPGRSTTPRHLGDVINTDAHELYPAVTADGTLYFSRFAPGGIWRAPYSNGRYETAEKLGSPINADMKEAGIYVAPNERYMIFEAKNPSGLGGTDFYISYRRDGEWTTPRNLGAPINSPAEETCAVVSPDGRYLFFTSNRKLPNTEVTIGKGLTYSEILDRWNALGRGRWHIYYVSAESLQINQGD
ncbi:MAG TPA: hypothetical protein VIG25_22235 [Pyrinomonadaceae bacterium]